MFVYIWSARISLRYLVSFLSFIENFPSFTGNSQVDGVKRNWKSGTRDLVKGESKILGGLLVFEGCCNK